MINSKSTKDQIKAAYLATDERLTVSQTELRIALVWAIGATLWAIAF